MIGLLTFSITIISLLFLLILILPVFKVPIQYVKDYATIFNNLSVGIGALFAGIGSFKYINGYLLKLKLEKKKKIFRKKYSLKNLNKDYYLIWFHRGTLYLFDKENKFFYHIKPWETAEDLSFVEGQEKYGKQVDFGLDPKSEIDIPIDENNTVRPKDYKNGGNIDTTVL